MDTLSTQSVADALGVSRQAVSKAARSGGRCAGVEVGEYATFDEAGALSGFDPAVIEAPRENPATPQPQPATATRNPVAASAGEGIGLAISERALSTGAKGALALQGVRTLGEVLSAPTPQAQRVVDTLCDNVGVALRVAAPVGAGAAVLAMTKDLPPWMRALLTVTAMGGTAWGVHRWGQTHAVPVAQSVAPAQLSGGIPEPVATAPPPPSAEEPFRWGDLWETPAEAYAQQSEPEPPTPAPTPPLSDLVTNALAEIRRAQTLAIDRAPELPQYRSPKPPLENRVRGEA
jgi:hypothetical protein